MTPTEMRTQIRFNLNDENDTLFTDVQLMLGINAAIRKLYLELLKLDICFNKTTTTLTFTAENQFIDLPSPFSKLFLVTYEDSKVPIQIMTQAEAENQAFDAVFRYNYKLGWFRIPSSSIKVIIFYAPGPTKLELEDNTEPMEIPPEYHDVITTLATVMMLGSDEDNVQFWNSIFEREFATMMETINPINHAMANTVDIYSAEYHNAKS